MREEGEVGILLTALASMDLLYKELYLECGSVHTSVTSYHFATRMSCSVQSDVCLLEQVRYLARMSSEHLLDIVF